MRTIRTTSAASALIALLLAGCGGGGGGSSLTPAAATGNGAGLPASTQRAAATLTFAIPSGGSTSAAKRSPKYISAATKSIGVAVAPSAGGTPVNATIDVGSSACTAATGTAPQTCSITVQAPIGSDVFTVTMYDAAGGTGNVLSTGTMTQTVAAHVANTFPLTLGGTIAKLAVSISNPNLPVVDGGSSDANVAALDAAGNTIVGGYASPVNVTLAGGLTTNAGTTTMNGSSDAHLSIKYDGVSKTALAVTATSGSVSGSANVVPTTHAHTYTGTTILSGASPFRLVKGPDGAVYFGDIGTTAGTGGNSIAGTSPGAIGRLDPATGTISEVQISGVDPISLLFVGNDLYFTELNSGAVGKIAGAGAGGFSASNYSEQKLPNAPPTGLAIGTSYDGARDLAVSNGILYVTTYGGHKLAAITLSTWNTGATIPEYAAPATTAGVTVGGDGKVYLIQTNGYVRSYTPGATALAAVGNVYGSTVVYGTGRFAATGSDGSVYMTYLTYDPLSQGGVYRYTGSGFAQLPVISPFWGPDSIHAGSNGTITIGDLLYGSVDVYNPSAGNYAVYPLAPKNDTLTGTGANDAIDANDGSFYFSYGTAVGTTSTTALRIGRLVLAQGWQVLPEGTNVIDGLGPNGAIPLAIAESASAGDTVTVASATPSICSVTAANATTNMYLVSGVAAGTCTVTATDQNNRVVTETIPVTASTATISSQRRNTR